ncbi:hypothetical protein ARMGADRAFT_1170653 [Armillaria gallica]|uniref:Uncharacterized protein n=1 Tax=Armillaria gallica TaxID=47427 RepID=A0A2H3D282_ARMGA|nr:hypothetical protein ARMGADRAFT_1170653 [Armillaria gallica]
MSGLAANAQEFTQWATAALVGIVSPDDKPSVIEKEEENLRRLCPPKALQTQLTAFKNCNKEDPKTKKFAEDLLTSFDGQFTSDTDEYDLRYAWRELAALRNNLDFVINHQDPPPNEATSRCPVDVLLTQVTRMVAEKQNSKAIRYDHRVPTSMSKTYITQTPFNTSLSMTCDGMASYRLPGSTLSAINKFALKHRIAMEVTSSGEHAAYSLYLSLCMLVVEYKKNDGRIAHRQLLMDFAAILRHRRLVGFEQKHLLGITGCYTTLPRIAYYLTFYLGILDDLGEVQHWKAGTLNIMNPAELLKAYVWIANSTTQSVTQLKDWHFDSNAPRDIGNLVWRAKANSSANKRSGQGRRRSSGSSSEEFDASDECIVNDYKVPYYTASELICMHEDNDTATSEARERMRARQGEMPSDFVMRRYLDSLQTDVDGV